MEELETTSEELQSTSEELTSLYDEVQARNTQLSEANNDLLNLLESVDIPIIIVDKDGAIRRFTPNATALINLKAADIGRPLTDLSSRIDLANIGELIHETMRTFEPVERDVRDRSGKWHRLRVRVYRTDDNRIDGAVIALFDIYTLKALLGEADEAQHSKDRFLATLSHEIRTPLTAIISWAEMLREGSLNPETSKRAVESILGSAQTQAQLIEDLLDVSRIVEGKVSLQVEPVDVAVLVDEVFESLRFTARTQKITLHSGPHQGLVLADPLRLRQILSNLLTNSLKFSPQNTTVTVSSELQASPGGQWCEISVSDQGIGMEAWDIPRIFDNFSQVDSSTTRALGGLGLGLSIVKGLTVLHGGTVRAESGGSGRGAVFRVRLPALDPSTQAPPSEHTSDDGLAKPEKSELRGLDILVVEDDAATREVVTTILEFHGAQVRAVATAAEGYAALTARAPDVILSDIGLPGEDGYSLIRRVRAFEKENGGGHTAALALTAFAGHEAADATTRAGFDMYLAKPIGNTQLVHAVAEVAKGTVKAS